MARALTFVHKDTVLSGEIAKVERAKIYGRVDSQVLDRDGNLCYLGSLSDDGMHLFGRESFEQGHLNEANEWVDKGSLVVVDADAQPIASQPPSFKSEIELADTVSVDEYLLHTAKSVYQIQGDDAEALLALVQSADGILVFPFNYVTSYEPDPAFLIENDGALFMIVAQRTEVDFIEPDEREDIEDNVDEVEADNADDVMDFSMM